MANSFNGFVTQLHDMIGDIASAIEELGRASEEIGRIIGVINDIADQTNPLALNAAIDAAARRTPFPAQADAEGAGFPQAGPFYSL